MFGDGSESPKMQEVKYNYQNVFAEVNRETVTIRNRSLFTSTAAWQCIATLSRNGKEIARQELKTDVAPGETVTLPLPFPKQTRGGEYVVTLSFRQREATEWAEAGYEVAFGQGSWRVEEPKTVVPAAPVRVFEGVQNLGVTGRAFQRPVQQVAGQAGLLPRRRRGNAEGRAHAQLLACAYGKRLWQSYAPALRAVETGLALRYAYGSAAGNARSRRRREHPLSLRPAHRAGGSVRRSVHRASLRPGGCGAALRPGEGAGRYARVRHAVYAGCAVRSGAILRHGPGENYADRCHGAKLGLWETTAQENVSRYVLPQECGNRTGVRWAEITDFRGRGLRFLCGAENGMETSVLPYTPHELESARHPNELPPVYNTVVRVAKQQMGVGGDDSWGAKTHEEYLLNVEKPLVFRFSFEAVVR